MWLKPNMGLSNSRPQRNYMNLLRGLGLDNPPILSFIYIYREKEREIEP